MPFASPKANVALYKMVQPEGRRLVEGRVCVTLIPEPLGSKENANFPPPIEKTMVDVVTVTSIKSSTCLSRPTVTFRRHSKQARYGAISAWVVGYGAKYLKSGGKDTSIYPTLLFTPVSGSSLANGNSYLVLVFWNNCLKSVKDSDVDMNEVVQLLVSPIGHKLLSCGDTPLNLSLYVGFVIAIDLERFYWEKSNHEGQALSSDCSYSSFN